MLRSPAAHACKSGGQTEAGVMCVSIKQLELFTGAFWDASAVCW